MDERRAAAGRQLSNADVESIQTRRRFIKRVGLAGMATLVFQNAAKGSENGAINPLNPWGDQTGGLPASPGNAEPAGSSPPYTGTVRMSDTGIESRGGGAVGHRRLSGLSGSSGALKHVV